jgi:hypothetical protein
MSSNGSPRHLLVIQGDAIASSRGHAGQGSSPVSQRTDLPLTEMLNGILVPGVSGCAGRSGRTRQCCRPRWLEILTQTFAGLPQEFEGVGGGALRGSAIRISAVLLDEVRLKRCSDFICRLQRMVDGPVPCGVQRRGLIRYGWIQV